MHRDGVAPDIRRRVDGTRTLFDLHVDGVPVSHAVVHDLEMWIQGTRVRAGGVGGVKTIEAHRGKGMARILLESMIRWMRESGYLVSLLFGIPDYYDRFGYASFMASWRVRVAVADAARVIGQTRAPHVRGTTAEDAFLIVAWYNDLAMGRSASMARSARGFRGFRWGTYTPGEAAGWMVLDPQDGSPMAYLACREGKGTLDVIEAVCPEPSRYPVLLSALMGLAGERRAGDLTLEVPWDDPFARFLTRCGCRVEAVYPRSADGMLLVLDPAALLVCLQGKLEERRGRSHLRESRLEIDLETERGTARLAMGPVTGRLLCAAARLSLAELGQVLTGYRHAAEVIGAGTAADALDTVLGGSAPYVWQTDRF